MLSSKASAQSHLAGVQWSTDPGKTELQGPFELHGGPGLNPEGSWAGSPEKEATLGKDQVHIAEFTRHMLPHTRSFPESNHRRARAEAYQLMRMA